MNFQHWLTNRPPRFFAAISIVAAILTIGLKLGAYLVTDSVGMLSDAVESVVNLVAAVVAFWVLTIVSRPADDEHAFGHSKAEYLSSAVEGLLIIAAAVGIAVAAWGRLVNPRPLESLWLGVAISTVASVINGGVAILLLRAGKRLSSITLHADAVHLLTDVWTSVGVVVAIVLVQMTGLQILDPIVAMVVAANIIWTAVRVLRDTAGGVLDTALPQPDQDAIRSVLSAFEASGVVFHALRTRIAGQRRFIEVHVLIPGAWSVQRGHLLCEEIELKIRTALPCSTVLTHLEPVEDTVAYEDTSLDRPQ